MDNQDNKLFIGGIAWTTTEDGLKSHFSQAGDVVEVKIIMNRETGRSKGFGFVTMADAEGAEKAIKELDGKELDGRNLKVAKAMPQKPRE